MGLFGKNKKDKAAAPQKTLFAQDMMPLKTVQGSFMRRTDGKKVAAIWVEGTNDSLYTTEQKLIEAEGLVAILASINHSAAICKLPKAIDSSANLVFIDSQIAALRDEIASAGPADAGRVEGMRRRLRLLEENLRPLAEQEALEEDRETHPTYITVEFEPDIDDAMAMRDMRIIAERIEDTDRKCHICDQRQLIELLQLFFTPESVRPDRKIAREVPYPAYHEGMRPASASGRGAWGAGAPAAGADPWSAGKQGAWSSAPASNNPWNS